MTNPTSDSKTSLLIVEDSRIQARVLSDKLTAAGYDVRTAENGQIGLDMIREDRPMLVISDIEMPLMNGYELCEKVKSDLDLRTIPFILLSTLSDAQDIIKGLHCGADNYVTKPYDPEFLVSRVASLLETPLDDGEDEEQLDVTLGGTRYSVKAGRQQVLNLLVSTFENAVEKNNELLRTNEELAIAKEKLTQWNKDLESLNDQLATANARMSQDLRAAAKVQESLLPTSQPETPRANFAWNYLPCDELAGDFLNLFALDEKHIALYVVDVSGHGVAPSLLAVNIGRLLSPKSTASSLLAKEPVEGGELHVVPPADIAFQLNQLFPMNEQNDFFFTMVYGILNLETLEFRFVSAGHDPIVHVRKGNAPQTLEGSGMAIGWVEGIEYEDQVVQLEPGDRLYLYSDGVPEAMDEELEQFTMKQMMEIIELGQAGSLDASVSLLLNSVKRWSVKEGPKDDISILAVEITDSN